jgi:ribosome biogenesis protein SSF1/2
MVLRLTPPSASGPSLTRLVHDFRLLMSPDTAARLRERRANRLKDYLAMTGPLGVTHLFMFSRSKVGGNVHLRVGLTPRGPTLTYRVESYTLGKDVVGAQRRPRAAGRGGRGMEYRKAPLVVLNNFTRKEGEGDEKDPVERQLEGLVTTVWQGVFPAITPSATPLSSVKRIMLLNRETGGKEGEGRHVVSLRHYAITTRESGVSRKVRRFDVAEQRKREKRKEGRPLPNLGGLEDAADYVLGGEEAGGYTSASDTEMDSENEVEVLEAEAHKVIGRKERQRLRAQREAAGEDGEGDGEGAAEKQKASTGGSRVEKRAVKLVELGPRMRLRLIKVEEGICEGKVMWNEFVKKTEAQKDELDQRWKTRRAEKEERRRIQRENVARKRGEAKKGEDGEPEDGMDVEYGSDLEPEDFDEVDEADDVDGGAVVEDDEEEWSSDNDGADAEEHDESD